MTGLMLAAEHGLNEDVSALIEHKANVNFKNSFNNTALGKT